MIRSNEESSGSSVRATAQHVGELLGVVGRYAKTRWALFRVEGKEAFNSLGIAAALAVAAVVLGFFAYLLLVSAAVVAVGVLLDGKYGLALSAAAFALLHLLAMGGAAWWALKRVREPKLKQSIEELRKEQAWVHSLAKN